MNAIPVKIALLLTQLPFMKTYITKFLPVQFFDLQRTIQTPKHSAKYLFFAST